MISWPERGLESPIWFLGSCMDLWFQQIRTYTVMSEVPLNACSMMGIISCLPLWLMIPHGVDLGLAYASSGKEISR